MFLVNMSVVAGLRFMSLAILTHCQTNCPFCRKPWTQEEREYPLRSLVVALNTIANWPDSGENALKVKAQFELDGGADG